MGEQALELFPFNLPSIPSPLKGGVMASDVTGQTNERKPLQVIRDVTRLLRNWRYDVGATHASPLLTRSENGLAFPLTARAT